MASPADRLPDNAPGDFFVDSSCIDCGACRWIAPATFDHGAGGSRVHRQPEGDGESHLALRALVSCPTSSIGAAGDHDVRAVSHGFPYPLHEADPDVLHCGYHDESSYGAASYLIVRPQGNVLVDSPRFAKPLVRRIEALGGVKTMFLTHCDDVADHAKFAAHFGCERVMHADDIRPGTRAVERQLVGDEPIRLADDLLVIPTPGHTRGSACLLFDERCLFTGDHLAWRRQRSTLYAFRGACWYDWRVQIDSVARLADHRFEHVLPGHGAPHRLPAEDTREHVLACVEWMKARA